MTTQPATASDRAGWYVKDSAILAELRELMALTAEDARRLSELQPQAQMLAPRLAEAFYDRLMRHENTADYLRQTSLEARHQTIGQWFVDLFGGTYDEAYVAKRMKIGQVHVRIGLPVRYPLAMIDVLMQFGALVTQLSPAPEQALSAFRKALSLDIAIFNQAYEDRQIAHLAEMVGGERLAWRLLSGQG